MNGAAAALGVLNAGQSSDMHLVLARVAELIELMRTNREDTQKLMESAEEIAIRAHANSQSPTHPADPAGDSTSDQPPNSTPLPAAAAAAGAGPQTTTQATAQATAHTTAQASAQASRIADLTRQKHRLESQLRSYVHEQKENTRLIGEYEIAMGQLCELVRDFASKRDLQLGAQAREYNALLQEEKDRHLQTRLARDEWQANYGRAAGMLRTAYALRCKEEEMPVGVVQALQAEVRALRKVVGLEEQAESEEAGWPVLKDALAGEAEGSGEP